MLDLIIPQEVITATYRIASGFDVPLISLITLVPQCRSEGIKYARRTYGGDGTVYQESPYIELEWDMLGSAADYQALIDTIFGVTRPATNEVTVYLKNEYGAFLRMNGIAVTPEPGREIRHQQYFYRDLVVLIKDLAIAS